MGYDDPWEQSVDARHGGLAPLAPNLWWAWSVLPMGLGRNLVVVRLADGGLLLHSPLCLPEAEMARLDALGPVRFLLVPNAGHRTDAKRFRRRYPDAKLVAPRAAVRAVEEVVPVDASCEDALPDAGVLVHVPDGMSPGYELVYQVPIEGGGHALLVNDILGDPHPHGPGGFQGLVMRVLGTPGGRFGQPRIVRFRFCQDRAAFSRFVSGLAALPDVRVLTTSHGAPVTRDVAGVLREAAGRI